MNKELEAIKDDKLRIGLLGLKRLFEANTKKMTNDEIMAFDFTFMNIANALLKAQEDKKILDILKRIIKVKPSDVYEFTLVVRGTDEEEDTIKEWLENE